MKVFDSVKEILVKLLGVEEDRITMDARLTEDLKADSIDKAELVTEMEDRFDIIVDYDEALKVKTVGDMVTAIEKIIA